MKIKLLHLACTMLLFANLTLLLPVNTMASGSINWYSYKEGMVTGRIEKKKMFLHFYAKLVRVLQKKWPKKHFRILLSFRI